MGWNETIQKMFAENDKPHMIEFTPSGGKPVFFGMDYSKTELRVLAHMESAKARGQEIDYVGFDEAYKIGDKVFIDLESYDSEYLVGAPWRSAREYPLMHLVSYTTAMRTVMDAGRKVSKRMNRAKVYQAIDACRAALAGDDNDYNYNISNAIELLYSSKGRAP